MGLVPDLVALVLFVLIGFGLVALGLEISGRRAAACASVNAG